VHANEAFRPDIRLLARTLNQLIERERFGSVSIGAFTAPAGTASAAGTGLRKLLVEELSRLGVTVKNVGGDLGVQGTVIQREHDQLTIRVSLTDSAGEELTHLNAQIKLGPSGSTRDHDGEFRNGILQVRRVHPASTGAEFLGQPFAGRGVETFAAGPVQLLGGAEAREFIDSGTTARVNRFGAPFGLQVVVVGRPLALTLQHGRAFVELNEGDEFQLRFLNDAPFDVAVAFHLDGVNTFAYSDIRVRNGSGAGRPAYSRWIVSGNSSMLLKGWHRTNDYVDRFLVTDFSDSPVARLSGASELGLITATVRRTWTENELPAEDEDFGSVVTTSTVGMGLGNPIVERVVEDRSVRYYGGVRAVIPIRYTKD
jgi:hypothetical protein